MAFTAPKYIWYCPKCLERTTMTDAAPLACPSCGYEVPQTKEATDDVREDALHTLKPCPFCGGRVQAEALARDRHIIDCLNDDCPADVSVAGETLEMAAERWNTRAAIPSAPALAEEVKRLREALGTASNVLETIGYFLRSKGFEDEARRMFSANKRARAALQENSHDKA